MKWTASVVAVAFLAAQSLCTGAVRQDLIKSGTQSPDFQLEKPDGSKLDLLKAVKGHKATIVNFWHYH